MIQLNANKIKMSSIYINLIPSIRFCIYLLSISTIFFIQQKSSINAQIVSHEIRRLAVATNQFGIDTLKVLDRLERHDKVLVFCPVCLSSSLMMILMGSSKYPVVSSLRHALYVWSMKPKEINKGFKGILDHIGWNQPQQQVLQKQQQIASKDYRGTSSAKNVSLAQQNEETRSFVDSYEMVYQDHLPLQVLMNLRELAQRSIKIHKPNSNKFVSRNSTLRDKRFIGDLSQMSGLSGIYIQKGLSLNHNYNLLLWQYFKTIVHPVDFIRSSEETRQHINSLIASNTEGKVKDLIKRGSLEKTKPKILMISTFHFRGTLDLQMKGGESSTVKKSLKSSSNLVNSTKGQIQETSYPSLSIKSPIFIETDVTLLKYGSFSNVGCSVLEIPFNNRLVSLVIIMPNHQNSTELLLTKLSAQVLFDMINSLKVRRLSIEIPVIKFDRGPIDVAGLLKGLGLEELFYGHLFQSSETGLNRWMRPSDIVHETSIDIGTINPEWAQTEDRLKVGAHDSLTLNETRKRDESSEINHIRLDKSFFYFVLDSINGLVLTMGRIRQ